MARPVEIYLDIETDWDRGITVLGFRSSETGLVQLVGREITRSRLRRELPPKGRLYTFNGHCFDLACIRAQLRLDLSRTFDSCDLLRVCRETKLRRLRGGQKRIEQRIGFTRTVALANWWEPMNLWRDHRAGDPAALQVLLRYNADDINGLIAIKRHLASRGLLSKFGSRRRIY
jgi:uncharacterized protein YprB with RNaseH-like and TPR domain